MNTYRKRIADTILLNKLEAMGAVLIEGPKGCGKTATALQIATSNLFMEGPSPRDQTMTMAKIAPSNLLIGDTPRLIDEWQVAPQLWNAIRFEIDMRDAFGQFILTGSSVPAADMSSSHTGTGRITRMRMRPMALFESGDSHGSVSLRELFSSQLNIAVTSDLDITRIAFLICRGGWPKAVGQPERIALQQAIEQYDAIVESEISRPDGVSRNPQRVRNLMLSYSKFIASDASITTIQQNILAKGLSTLHYETILSYITALKGIFVIEDLPAWLPKLRTKTAIRTTDTRHFIDPSIATAAMGIGPKDLLNDLQTMGLFFESMCIRDLRVFAEALDGSVYHYRDKTDLECDAVIHLRDGSYALIEVKLGAHEIDKAASNLQKIQNKIDTERMKKPSFLMVLTATKYGYRREDGVYVVPLGCLRD